MLRAVTALSARQAADNIKRPCARGTSCGQEVPLGAGQGRGPWGGNRGSQAGGSCMRVGRTGQGSVGDGGRTRPRSACIPEYIHLDLLQRITCRTHLNLRRWCRLSYRASGFGTSSCPHLLWSPANQWVGRAAMLATPALFRRGPSVTVIIVSELRISLSLGRSLSS